MSGWSSEFYAADVYMRYMQEATTESGTPRSCLTQVAHGLEDWDARLAERRGVPGQVRDGERYEWAVSAFSATAHDIITEAVNSVDLDQYGPETVRPVECAHRIVERVVLAWRTVLTDLIRLRDQGQLRSFADWESVAEQASGAIEMARNATLAAYR